MPRANLDKQPGDVKAMFDHTAARYDLMNDLMTGGLVRSWRRSVVQLCKVRKGDVVLDLAAGTGMSSDAFADVGAKVVPADFSLGMLRVGKRRRPDMSFTAADATRLPFADDSFDLVTISYGIRNVVDYEQGLREMLRVTKPGGKLVIAEFSSPTITPFRTFYREYIMRALPAIASTMSSNPESYVYLAESIREWPDQMRFAETIRRCGWSQVGWRNLAGGIVALHHAVKPTS